MKEFCPDCEIKAAMALVTPESIAENISKMAYVEGVTSSKEVYDFRMSVCRECTSFEGGMTCRECGSLSAYRARILKSYCPYPGKNKWENNGDVL